MSISRHAKAPKYFILKQNPCLWKYKHKAWGGTHYKWISCSQRPTFLPHPLRLPHPSFNNEDHQAACLEEIHNHCTFLSQLLETAPASGGGCYAAPRPAQRERMEAALKMKDAPQGRASAQEQKGTSCKCGSAIRRQPQTWCF